MFFVFEGLDGSGKSTQLELLAQSLAGPAEVVTCKDPGTTRLGEALRSLLLQKTDMPIDMRSEMMLFATARTQLVQEIIQPALQRGAFVLLDRFVLSSLVYQGHAGRLDPEDVRRVNRFACDGLWPALTFVFDVPVATAMQRLGDSKDRMESRGQEYFEAVRQGFLQEADQNENVAVIDGTQDVAVIEKQVFNLAQAVFQPNLTSEQAVRDALG